MSDHVHSHTHRHGSARLKATLCLVALYMLAEVVGGLLTNSLALLADAGHMLSDVAALGLALFAIWFARRPASARHTYGYYRTEILAALLNGATLIAISIFIFFEAIQRMGTRPAVAGGPMMAVATGGLLVNLLSLWVLRDAKDQSLNLRGAWMHVLSDALGSVQAMLAGALIWAFGWYWADPLASILIGCLVIWSAWGLLGAAVAVLMERAPGHIDVERVRKRILATPGVVSVHDLHVWTITSGLESLSAHVIVSEHPPRVVLTQIREVLHQDFGIHHVTVQLEDERCAEDGACDDGRA